MNTIWFILFILFLIIRAAGKNKGPHPQGQMRQPWDNARRRQAPWMSAEPSPHPAEPSIPQEGMFDPDQWETEWMKSQTEGVKPKIDEMELPISKLTESELPAPETAVQAVPQPAPPEGKEEAGLVWNREAVLQGIIFSEILQRPGARGIRGRR